MDFICQPCKNAADAQYGGPEAWKRQHEECKGGTHCDCQHRVKK